ncbi:hypothetical protein AVEN_16718-1 [Araneus ventricosus]|uniref:Uncharacterized protein n=1 Tax=Araneus ventricosus TaxID=182803 RepID=A0A4Y2JZQ1_ARAVE|nr:hypothetical protein AVEN_16718-1 [Araneus ventricosus]
MKRREIILPEQFSAVWEDFSRKRLAEDESDPSDVDGDVTEYSDSVINEEDKPVDEKYSNSNLVTNVCIIHRFNF